MNLNYDNLVLEGISEETKALYAFPKDKEFLHRYMRGEAYKTKKDEKAEHQKGFLVVSGCAFSLGLGTVSYFSLMNPGGKVLRDAYDAALPLWRRIARRAIPFTLLVLPFVVAREYVDMNNYDYKSWK